jgi:serine/threonine protein phosphatase PrpC
MNVEWGAVCRPKSGQTISGDTYLVERFGANELLVSVIDGLGGGEQAAHAANGAAKVFRNNPDRDPLDLVRQAHQALQGTRGCVAALLTVNLERRSLVYVGVGNIGTHVIGTSTIKPISKNGIIGYRLPQLLKLSYTYNSGDTFVLYSDGISSKFALEPPPQTMATPQLFAEAILQRHGKSNDDATVLVLRTS